jgi:hypothetical protein
MKNGQGKIRHLHELFTVQQTVKRSYPLRRNIKAGVAYFSTPAFSVYIRITFQPAGAVYLLCQCAPKEDQHLYGRNVRKLQSACR